MEGKYPIMLGRETVGETMVHRQGLYYWFSCRCKLQSQVMYRVTLSCGGHQENLGILAPEGGEYRLHKKIPIKTFSQGKPEFWITPKHHVQQNVFVDVYPEEPFGYIARLQNACLERRRERSGIVIRLD